MRIDESMKLLKEYSYVVEDFDRMVLANHEVTKDGYSYELFLISIMVIMKFILM